MLKRIASDYLNGQPTGWYEIFGNLKNFLLSRPQTRDILIRCVTKNGTNLLEELEELFFSHKFVKAINELSFAEVEKIIKSHISETVIQLENNSFIIPLSDDSDTNIDISNTIMSYPFRLLSNVDIYDYFDKLESIPISEFESFFNHDTDSLKKMHGPEGYSVISKLEVDNVNQLNDLSKNKVSEIVSKSIKSGFRLLKLIESKPLLIESLSVIDLQLYEIILKHPDLLKTLNWRTFEKLLADILETLGYEIQLMQGTKDNGIDIIAFMKNNEFGTHKYLLQAKRWTNKVDVDIVKNVLFNHDFYKVTKSCIATTAAFTRGAWQLAEAYKWQLELKDFNSLVDWLRKAHAHKKK